MAEKKFRNNYLFDYLKNILTLKSKTMYENHLKDDFEGSYQPYMINNYVSMSLDTKVCDVIFENQISLDRMQKKDHYFFLLKAVPRQQKSLIRYIRWNNAIIE